MAGRKTDDGRARRVTLYELIRESYAANGYAPRTTELAAKAGIPHTSMLWHLRSLREQGYIKFSEENRGDITRTLRPVQRRDPKMIE